MEKDKRMVSTEVLGMTFHLPNDSELNCTVKEAQLLGQS